ncbi:MAG: efflux RND transporter periplasmic adaptor subunit [Paludibacteraceae bacterium]|nr:efflux RND transporter periplasmic adaptor subunit [Paludibacteraceae bacterium]MBN2787687.1 efflux RND transporter periplasmic adaptor subunit [Paludibacteraceae bacterium]
MKKKIIYIVLALALVFVVVIRLKNNKETTQKRVYQYDKETPISVQVDTLQLEFADAEYSYTGSFEPNKESKISADIQGKISKLLVDIGSNVRTGQPVIQLDNSLLKLQLQSVKVQIEGLEADVRRYTVLANAEAIQGVQLEKTELALKSANVQKATLLEQINKTTIKAPFNGVVTAKMTEEGAFAAPGVPLLQITDISNLKFTINLPEQEINQFEMQQSNQLTVDAFPDIKLKGKVTMIGSKANVGNSFPVQFSLANTPDLKIKSGMSGRVLFASKDKQKYIIIPSSSIQGSNSNPQVFKVKQGKAKLVDISISKRFGNKAIVEKGLVEGDVLVTNGFITLFDGATVSIKN